MQLKFEIIHMTTTRAYTKTKKIYIHEKCKHGENINELAQKLIGRSKWRLHRRLEIYAWDTITHLFSIPVTIWWRNKGGAHRTKMIENTLFLNIS
jgi:hypothetical protein